VVRNYNPDLIIYAGDREDVIVGGLLGAFLHIPTLHFFGGDHASDGHVDNPVRHATSKLSSFHAVTIDEHRKRLLSIGEEEENIFVIGNPALDKFLSIKPCDKDIIFNSLQCSDEFLNGKFAIVIFHAISEEIEVAACYFENILLALKKSGYKAFVSYPNTDPGGKTIINVINKYKEDQNFYFYKNLNREMFLSLYKYSSLIIGNSSSGIIESASIKIPCINVGNRQFNRANSGNVLFCDGSLESIISAIVNVNSDVFQEKLHNIINIYGSGNSCVKAFNLIKNLDLSSYPSKKYDPLFKSIL
jgi:UDP-N-acetylglucosamine 2-epimerase (non-hydrolysing)/GDP/UDP-N,N'-diacetylbacillosamine 2-epimerase (hydrolysing)